MEIREQIRKISNSPVFWIFAFAVCISPLSFTYIMHYVDEMHYTDAAIQMLRNHDYLTPLKADGTPRFLKPIFSYWMIAGSYKIFGISQFSSRFPFLICGLLLLWVTYRITFKLTQNKNISLFALLIAATNPLLILSSARSIPDIPQALFFAIGALGLAGIFISKNPTKKDLWLFYASFALAFATKGIPAALFWFLSFVFLLFNPWKKYKLSKLINWPAIISGLAIALFWYVIMYVNHGNDFIISFYKDQVGGRISEDKFRILKNVAFALLTIIGYFAFFILPIISLKIKAAIRNGELPVSVLLFSGITLTWLIAMFVFSVFTVKFYDRYFLPVFPLISVLIAILFHVLTGKNTLRCIIINRTIIAVAGTFLSLISLTLSIRLGIFQFAVIFFGLMILFSVFIFAFKNQGTLQSEFKKQSALILLIILDASLLIRIFGFPDQGIQIAGYLNSKYEKGQEIVFYGQPKVAAKLNVSTSGDFNICCIDPIDTTTQILTDSVIIYRQDLPPIINTEKYTVENISNEWKIIPVIPLLSGEKIEFINETCHTRYKIATVR